MRPHPHWLHIIALWRLLFASLDVCDAMTTRRRLDLRDKVQEMFYHGWDSYIKYAYPQDELNPLSCTARSRNDSDPDAFHVNDVLAGVSVTLLDTLDTFAVMNDRANFSRLVHLVISRGPTQLDVPSRVQVFETTIRVLGGLLSAHLLATNSDLGFAVPAYSGELLSLAQDLGRKLLPAFDASPTDIPFARVNLMHGVLPWEVNDTCTAGAGTLILEFGILSRLTNDPTFEKVAKKALMAIWDKRSELDLVGNTLSVQTGKWIHRMAGIECLETFESAYAAVMSHIRDSNGFVYKNVNMDSGQLVTTWIDSLAAFFPGLQVLYGDVESAARLHHLYFALWRRFKSLPERFDWTTQSAVLAHYPLRPELVESTFMLYRATKHPHYLQVGEEILQDLNSLMRVKCGFASLADVVKKTTTDRMESFFLSETLKYLYLLFDEDNVFNHLDSNFVFSTEGHVFVLPHNYSRTPSATDKSDMSQPTQLNTSRPETTVCPLNKGIWGMLETYEFRNHITPDAKRLYPPIDLESTKAIHRFVGLPEDMDPVVDTMPMCNTGALLNQQPLIILAGQTFTVAIDAPSGANVPLAHLTQFSHGFTTSSVAGLQLNLQVDIASPDAFMITSITDPTRDVSLVVRPGHVVRVPKQGRDYAGVLAAFGRDIAAGEWMDVVLQPLLDGHGILWDGCTPYQGVDVAGRVPLVLRGACMFAAKAKHAEAAGAVGLVVVARDNRPFTMSSANETWSEEEANIGIPVIMVGISFLRHLLSLPYEAVDGIICGPRLNSEIECGVPIDSETQLSHLYEADTQIQFNNLKVRNFEVVLVLSGRERRVLDSGRPLANSVSGILDPGQGIGCAGGCIADTRMCCRDLVGLGLGVGGMGSSRASHVRNVVASDAPGPLISGSRLSESNNGQEKEQSTWWDWLELHFKYL
ncbi:hypothetical protein SeMB42_g02136 [Synchytrium endobioticum]|uniref:alpha-1,2-Mannosidase n=1 Tax=Synchytrium endobioticum TaxID=286115 RepID=A0A507DIT4_9FUNG|nr:hypothetical protein SeMB42_g02136 [Synchytrium endobioticum]